MSSLLIGSTALKHHFPDYRREPKDVDVFSDDPDVSLGVKGIEIFWHPALAPFVTETRTATPDELYTIKVSHIFWDNGRNWEKHIYDIQFLESKGAQLIPAFYDVLYSIWEEKYGKKRAKLNVDAKDFFKSTVKRIYDHDSIHHSVAYYDEPLFNKILRDGSEVAVDKAKFDALSYGDKIKLVREEVYATALERQLIPANYAGSPRAAYAWSLKKLITSFSKGWFPLWVVLNYGTLYRPDIDYVKKHKQNNHLLVPLEG